MVKLIWSTYLAGPGYDRAYGIEVDAQGYVYVAGRTGRNFPTTPGAFQPTFQSYNGGGYGGYQNAFVAKLSPDGSKLLWANYVGVGQLCRDIAIDAQGNICLPLVFPNKGNLPPAAWFTNAFQKRPRGGMDVGAVKATQDGSQVLWATWLGGSGDENQALAIRVDAEGYIYLGFSTRSNDMTTTPGAFDRSYNGGGDFFVAKLNPEASDLIFGTYLGGLGGEWISTHNLALDDQGNVYVSTWTSSPDYPTTTGAVQTKYGGGNSDIAVSKLSPTGVLLASTYLGGTGDENPDGIYADASGNLFLTGDTSASNLPVTGNAWQTRSGGGHDTVIAMLSPDLTTLPYSTYLGGPSYDNGRSGFLGEDGSLYVTGSTDGAGWPIQNAYQDLFMGDPGEWGAGDCILAKFTPAPIAYDLNFSTYMGGSRLDQIRDVGMDLQSNIYITGGTASADFPTTPGAYDRTFATGGTKLGSNGPMDIFVAKFGPTGQLIWSTYLGGPNYDRAYAIAVDVQGYVYVAGRASDGFP